MTFNRATWLAVVSATLISTAALAEVTGADQPQAATPAIEASADEAPALEAPAVEAPASQTPAAEPADAPPAAAETPAPAPPATASAAAVTVGRNTLPAPVEGMGQVVFYRPSKLGGMALSFSVREDGKGLGKLGNGSYFVLAAAPGTHTYTIESEAKDSLTLEVDAGEVYYVEQTIGMGVMVGRPHIAPSTAEAFGRKALKLSTRKGNDASELAQNQTAAAPAK